MKAVKLKIIGDVQGVFYRHYTQKEAKKLGIAGWTKNEHDGSVTIVAQGSEEAVTNIIEWAKVGSPMATVEKVEIKEIAVDEGLKGFIVK